MPDPITLGIIGVKVIKTVLVAKKAAVATKGAVAGAKAVGIKGAGAKVAGAKVAGAKTAGAHATGHSHAVHFAGSGDGPTFHVDPGGDTIAPGEGRFNVDGHTDTGHDVISDASGNYYDKETGESVSRY